MNRTGFYQVGREAGRDVAHELNRDISPQLPPASHRPCPTLRIPGRNPAVAGMRMICSII